MDRLQLQALLETLCPTVYFQAPSDIQMQYPCILYNVDGDRAQFADNIAYRRTRRYTVTVIDRDPDSDIPDKVAKLPMCTFDRFFAADNLNHNVFTLFF